MSLKSKSYIFLLVITTFVISCTSDTADEELLLSNTTIDTSSQDQNDDSQNQIVIKELIRGADGCTNVVIVDGYAYAACDTQIQIAELATGAVTMLSSAADDITADSRGAIFTQSGATVRMFTLEDPMAPLQVATGTADGGPFSGISAAGCSLVISGGVLNTRVFRYSFEAPYLELTTNGIPIVDQETGAPDVHVAITGAGEVTAFYSEDIGNVANWAIQPVVFNGAAELQSTPARTVLTQGSFPGPFGAPFGPANFPVESEFLDGRLYVAHFAAQGIEVVDVASGNLLSPFSLPYDPINIGTDGESLFVVGVTNDQVDVIDPDSGNVIESLGNLNTPSGVAADATHIAVADQLLGLVIIPRN
ncbi:hypothetical protein [Dokdonia sp.]|uniref:YncE family protein n=1 Tax=Dokdonia sp. TaxID=2024995 RepID=UPI003264817D